MAGATSSNREFPVSCQERDEMFKDLADLAHDQILQLVDKINWRGEGNNGVAILLGLNPNT